ncbi:MAG TPA: asparagine synthase-related protein [Tepidisphaeraceae bacterium]|nr:asparagine synthase-related protein [Tepidisphaeraceae bacterium]
MCGLAGIITWDDRYRIDHAQLESLSADLSHRGPDGQGLYLNHDQEVAKFRPQCGLVHRRMAVIDLDERSLQPFDDGRNGKWMVFNGEIYNYRELRRELSDIRPNYRWRTESDTEVLLLALDQWGTDALRRVNGMLSLALWDETTQSLLLARDRMGQKPLYFCAVDAAGNPWTGFLTHETDDLQVEIFSNAQCPAAIAFASELSALRRVPWFVPAVDYYALAEYLRWGYVPGAMTIYRGAWKLAPASWMRLHQRGCDRESYFDPNHGTATSNLSPEQAVSQTRALVQQAVKRQLVSDVPLGCFLSGGVDSSVIALAMRQAAGDRQSVHTFSIGFDDARYDETAHAQAVAGHLGTRHTKLVVRPNAAEDLPRLAGVYGEPFADSSALPTHYLARAAREHVKVALSGDGGDELFGGYDRYRAMKIAERIRALPLGLGDVVSSRIWQALPGIHPKGRITRLKRLLRTAIEAPADRYSAYMRFFDERTLQPLLGVTGGIVDTLDSLVTIFTKVGGCRDVVQAALATDRVTYLPDDLLTKVDRASMLHALEVRAPFMDHDLVTFAAGLSTPQLLKGGGKRLLREAFAAQLPREVFTRRKMGFALPIGEWLRGELRPMVHDLLFAKDSFLSQNMVPAEARKLVDAHEALRFDHSHRIYAMLMLELWWRRFRQ